MFTLVTTTTTFYCALIYYFWLWFLPHSFAYKSNVQSIDNIIYTLKNKIMIKFKIKR